MNRWLVTVLLVAMGAASAGADSGLPAPVDALARRADLIVTGRCQDVRSAWVGRALVTLATIGVRETLKGSPVQSVTVLLPGGVDLNRAVPIAMTVPGAPRLAPGEETLLFLVRDPGYGGALAVLSQGKFSIVRDGTGRQLAARDQTSLRTARPGGIERGTGSAVDLTLVRYQIRRALR
jgi:hypothetical protein